jgi:hypothetical protein
MKPDKLQYLTPEPRQESPWIMVLMSLGLLVCCIILYYATGIFGTDFPTRPVLYAIPFSLAIWVLSAALDPKKYLTWCGFLGSNIFATTAIIAIILMVSKAHE